jgi:NTP pyrophosphatase (non-canonical NTP hydrolase)
MNVMKGNWNGYSLFFMSIYEEALQKWGMYRQVFVAIEELVELATELAKTVDKQTLIPKFDNIKKICKEERNSTKRDIKLIPKGPILEELADVVVMLAQVAHIFDFSQLEIDHLITKKRERVKQRLDLDLS